MMESSELKEKENKRPRIWLIKPGEGAEIWNDCVRKGTIRVGWREFVEAHGEKIFKFNEKEFKEEFKKFGQDREEGYKDSSQLWNFLREMSKGDILLAMRGSKEIIGIGIVRSHPGIDLTTDPDRPIYYYPIFRKVDWKRTDLSLDSPKEVRRTLIELDWEEAEKSPELKKIISQVLNGETGSDEIINQPQNLEIESEEKSLIDSKIKEQLENILSRKKQVILYGPPGTSKTWIARKYLENKSNEFVTFHPSYSYEEFVEGIRPKTDEEGKLEYRVEEGIFKRICREAFNELLNHAKVDKRWEYGKDLPLLTEEEIEKVNEVLQHQDHPRFYLLIDEINRGDISKIFGELITLLEADKRLFAENETIVTLPYSKEKFGVPPNLYIIGTMNTADRSIALIDVALRRRFGFIELMPDYELLEERLLSDENSAKEIKKLAIEVLKSMNKKIKQLYDRDHQIGHSYFLRLEKCNSKEKALKNLKEIWFYEIIPLLQEYFYDSPKKLKEVAGNFIELEENSNSYEIKRDFSDEDFLAELKKLAGESFG